MVCGLIGHKKADCRHKDKTCSVCGKVGHLKATCRAEGGGAFKAAAAPAPAPKKGNTQKAAQKEQPQTKQPQKKAEPQKKEPPQKKKKGGKQNSQKAEPTKKDAAKPKKKSPAVKPAPPPQKPRAPAKPKMRRGLPRIVDLLLKEADDGTFKVTIRVFKPPTSKPAKTPETTAKADQPPSIRPNVTYSLGMVYAAEKAAAVRLGKDLKSKPVRESKTGPELVLERDELIQVREEQ